MRHVSPLITHAVGRQRVVDLEELRQPRSAAQPQHPGQPAAPRGKRDGHRVVVELPGDEYLLRARLELGDELVRALERLDGRARAWLAEHRAQRSAQIALGKLAA